MAQTQKTVLITGAGGGLGGAAARLLADRGWHVFAADLSRESLAEISAHSNVTGIALDVTSTASVEAARGVVAAACDGLDGIVNFAGVLAVGSLVEIEEEVIRRAIEVNVLGTFRVNKAFFPLVLARKGRIVDISSEQGWQTPMPFVGAYTLSKYAVEAYTDSLRRELMFLGVPVIKVQPGPFRTSMVAGVEERFTRLAEGSPHFRELLMQLKHLTLREQANAHDPALLAAVIHDALTAPRPRARYSVRPDWSRTLLSLLPERLIDPLLRVALRLLARPTETP